jgi:predicted ATP-grasp superfamily ATP-dependent carboligase
VAAPSLATGTTLNAAGRPGALILGGTHASLAIARSLGRRGIPVWFLCVDHPLVRFSRYVQRSFTWTGADQPGALDMLMTIGRLHGLFGWLLFASADAEMRLIAENYQALSSIFAMTTPDLDIAQWSLDKRLTYRKAVEIGLDHPWTFILHDLAALASLDCPFPVIIKPATRTGIDALGAKAWRAEDHNQLRTLAAEAFKRAGAGALLVQECIPGNGDVQFSYAGLWERGAPVAGFVARRRRQFPADFGQTSTFVERVDRPAIEEAAGRFLQAIGYSGLVEVEFKHDTRDRKDKLLDVNARAWTWIGLGARIGIDLPYLAWQRATGQSVQVSPSGADAAWIYGVRDALAVAQELSGQTLGLSGYLSSLRQPLAPAVMALDDPVPAMVEIPLILSRAIVRRWRKAFGRA